MITVPCGRCTACTQRKAREWAFRLWHHNKKAKSAYFITLTYDNEHLPINECYTYAEFHKPDLQNFIKRLRDQNTRKYPEMGKLEYYAVAEYGGQTGRPHYHLILFNVHKNLIKTLDKLWYRNNKINMGKVDVQSINMATISYVAGYVIKRDIYKSDDLKRKREFSISSQFLGINYVEANFRLHQENQSYQTSFQGSPMAIPHYFREKIFEPEQLEQISEDNHLQRQYNLAQSPLSESQRKEHLYNKMKNIEKLQTKDKF